MHLKASPVTFGVFVVIPFHILESIRHGLSGIDFQYIARELAEVSHGALERLAAWLLILVIPFSSCFLCPACIPKCHFCTWLDYLYNINNDLKVNL